MGPLLPLQFLPTQNSLATTLIALCFINASSKIFTLSPIHLPPKIHCRLRKLFQSCTLANFWIWFTMTLLSPLQTFIDYILLLSHYLWQPQGKFFELNPSIFFLTLSILIFSLSLILILFLQLHLTSLSIFPMTTTRNHQGRGGARRRLLARRLKTCQHPRRWSWRDTMSLGLP